MGIFDQLLHLPYVYVWLPGLVFFAIVGGVYWLTRSAPQLAAGPAGESGKGALPSLVVHQPANQRTSSRRQGNTVEVHVAEPDDKKNPVSGSVLDRSMGGMRLAVFQEIETGTILSIRPVRANDMVPWIDLEVRSCKISTEVPGQFEVGCQYVKSPPYSIQLLFG